MARKHYKFTNKRHPLPAIMSTVLGFVAAGSLIFGIILSYKNKGDIPGRVGVAGLLIMIYSLVGLIISLVTVRSEDNYRLFSVLGILLNGLTLAMMFFLLWIST